MRKHLLSIAVFIVGGLLGPVIHVMTWSPPESNEALSSWINEFTYSLVLYVWPTQVFATMETSMGQPNALILAIGANLLLFGILGLLVAVIAKKRAHRICIYLVVCLLVALWALWGAGFSVTYLNGYALIVALLLYAIPFYVLEKLINRVAS